MNETKSVRYLSISKDMLKRFEREEFGARVREVCKIYRELEAKTNLIQDDWIKVADEDCFLYWREKVLLPDTRKIKATYLDVSVYKHNESLAKYTRVFTKVNKLSKQERESLKKEAEAKKADLPSPFEKHVLRFEASGMTFVMAQKVFRDEGCPFMDKNWYVQTGSGYGVRDVIVSDMKSSYYNPADDRLSEYEGGDQVGLKLSMHIFLKEETLFSIARDYGIIPDCLAEEEKKELREIALFHKDGVDFGDWESLLSYLINHNIKECMGISFDHDRIEEDILSLSAEIDMKSNAGAFLRDYYDKYDYHRARIQEYSSRWYLDDAGKGHWDLWASDSAGAAEDDSEGKCVIAIKDGIVARNPLSDIRYNAVVGIDFGTKSTIVAVQDEDDQIIPMRVGMADFLEEPKPEHYENPTVIQFNDMGAFLRAYEGKSGRPYTSWEDVLISHEAFGNMIKAKESREYASFVSNLKQWVSGRYGRTGIGRIVICDKSGARYDLENYDKLTEEDMDPIEFYAYYLGTFINNMYTGIYLDYMMSFPETFSLEIRKHLLSSFKKGIARSLPEAIFEDEETVAAFRVRQGASEPAAYAACALEQYGIIPTDEGIFYGVFDFGGGTTDFDYGIWKNAPETENAYDYVIQHFGAGGDKSLGGENLLELLAYYVFSDNEGKDGKASNQRMLREKKIAFCKPEEAVLFPGAESLVATDESAVLNTKQLMEVLRPIWEEHPVYQEWAMEDSRPAGQEGQLIEDSPHREEMGISCGEAGQLFLHGDSSATAEVFLFDKDGNNKTAVNLEVDMSSVNRILNERIEQGVRNFFEALSAVYKEKKLVLKEPVHLFLAGNSSKSKRVTALFDFYISECEEILFSGEKGTGENECPGFVLFPPLGTEEAVKEQEQRGMQSNENKLMAPTGKTGVAFGMLMCREGSRIKVESEHKKTEQVKFNYYIGINCRKKFKEIFGRKVEYYKWLPFIHVDEETETFEFYYTELPEAASGNVKIGNNSSIRKRKCMVDQSETGASVFFRFLDPSQLEYVVARKEDLDEGKYISSIYKVKL